MQQKLAVRGAIIFGVVFFMFLYFLLFMNNNTFVKIRREYIQTQYASEAITQSSQAVLIGNTLYVSGQIGIKGNHLINGSIYSETQQVMENIHNLLEKGRMKFSNVVKYTIYLKNIDDLEKVNTVMKVYFKQAHPTVDVIEVTQLPHNANIQISCIAIE